jgi:hypothetical protein
MTQKKFQNGKSRDIITLDELKQMDYQATAQEVMLEEQEGLKEIKNC